LKTIATSSDGIDEVFAAILAHQEHLQNSGIGAERESARLEAELAERLSAALLNRWKKSTDKGLVEAVLARIMAHEITPAQAVTQFLQERIPKEEL
jgi:putative protein kinase ArgK-like GTPase of G3E family